MDLQNIKVSLGIVAAIVAQETVNFGQASCAVGACSRPRARARERSSR